ncbi:MAG TPA: alginate lyase family protein [Blastocatellia bacterium]|nr:alginate lyase family protein [Blastocatellia bacterium]
MSAGEIAAEVFIRARRRLTRARARITDSPDSTYISDKELYRALRGQSPADVAAGLRKREELRLTAGLADLARTASIVKEYFPDSVEAARIAAENILAHRIKVFARAYDFGPVIDWHRDPETNVRWPVEHYSRVPIRLPERSDARVVWELNRLHHFTTLGRAYALTGDERYADEFLIQLASWYEENPPRFGINWKVAMEVAIRAINIIAAFEMFRLSPSMTDEAIELILKIIIAHGRFIRSNLEFSYRTASNHYLSNLTGLFALGMTMPEINESEAWVSFSAPRLIRELDRQVYRDGVNYEGSTGYHRLVLEMFALFFSISHANRIELPTESWERLEAMFDFTRHYLKPDGTAPMIGDTDDGRLIQFKERAATDHSYLLSIAAVLIEKGKFKQSSRIDEEAVWWFGPTGREAFESLPVNEQPIVSRAFPDGQIFIERDRSLYSIIDCGDHGADGRGSHAHSDALSIEVFAYGRTLLCDPGTFTYTASARWRNLFRSTAYHNTVRVDGKDISQITETSLFTLGPNVKPIVNHWESSSERDVLDAEHHAYLRLKQPVVHRRVVTFEKREGYWIIEDLFTGEGAHQFEFFFNFDAGLEVKIEDDQRAIAFDDRVALAVIPVSGYAYETKIAVRWVAPSYGTRLRASGIIYRLYADAPFANATLLVPYERGDEEKAVRIQESAGRIMKR